MMVMGCDRETADFNVHRQKQQFIHIINIIINLSRINFDFQISDFI